jgi:drug/metabolite transporter (DMT)-like permease
MKLLATLLGIALIVVAVIYFVVPADSLPGFFPGHETGVMRAHIKHGIVAGIAGLVLLAIGWIMGRR